MDNIGDWLYIVLMAMAGVSGLISNLRKKKKPVKTVLETEETIVEPSQETEGWWNTPIEQQPLIQKKFKKETFTKPTIPVEESLPLENESTPKPEIHFNSSEDARRAFIYSEIFQRKTGV